MERSMAENQWSNRWKELVKELDRKCSCDYIIYSLWSRVTLPLEHLKHQVWPL